MLNEIKKEMESVILKFNDYLSKIKLDGNFKGIVSNFSVNYYGNKMFLYQISSITEEGKSLIISPWDKECLKNIYDSINSSGLNLLPIFNSNSIKINFPFLSEERRNEIVKEIKKKSEDFKIELRNIRRNYLCKLSDNLKNKLLSLDEEKKISKLIQELTDEFVLKIDKIFFSKKKEIIINK